MSVIFIVLFALGSHFAVNITVFVVVVVRLPCPFLLVFILLVITGIIFGILFPDILVYYCNTSLIVVIVVRVIVMV